MLVLSQRLVFLKEDIKERIMYNTQKEQRKLRGEMRVWWTLEGVAHSPGSTINFPT